MTRFNFQNRLFSYEKGTFSVASPQSRVKLGHNHLIVSQISDRQRMNGEKPPDSAIFPIHSLSITMTLLQLRVQLIRMRNCFNA